VSEALVEAFQVLVDGRVVVAALGAVAVHVEVFSSKDWGDVAASGKRRVQGASGRLNGPECSFCTRLFYAYHASIMPLRDPAIVGVFSSVSSVKGALKRIG